MYQTLNSENVNLRFLAGNSFRLFLCAPTYPCLPRNRFLDVTQRFPKSFCGALRDIQKTAAGETNPTPQLPLTFLLLSGDLRGGNDKNKLSGKRTF